MTKQGGLKPAGRATATKVKSVRGWAELRGNREILRLFLELVQEIRQAIPTPLKEPAPPAPVSRREKPRKRQSRPRTDTRDVTEVQSEVKQHKEVVKIGQNDKDTLTEDFDFRQTYPSALVSLSCMPIFICYRIYSLISSPGSSPLQFSRQIAQQHYSRAKSPTPPTEGSVPASPQDAMQEV